jgi:Amiloride-sensitive sodium channel
MLHVRSSPTSSEISGIEICGISKIRCYEDAKFKVLQQQMADNVGQGSSSCNCLPGCVSISYDAEVYQSYRDQTFVDTDDFDELPSH